MSETIAETFDKQLTPPKPLGPKVRGRVSKNPHLVPTYEDPVQEIKRLTQEHYSLTKAAVAVENMARDKKSRTTGEVIKCRLPDDAQTELLACADAQKRRAKQLEPAMVRQLKRIPVYNEFLSKVYGFGPIVCSYIVSEINISVGEKRGGSTKPSAIRRFCGLAVINGKMEKPQPGKKNAYSKEMRTRLYQAFMSMFKNASKVSEDRPNGTTCKYLDIWANYHHRMQNSPRYDVAANTLDERKGARAIIRGTGWHKAADIFIEDLYVIWRSIEGLPVWPSYYAAKLGYEHGGRPLTPIPGVNVPKMLTLEEAKTLVGEIGPRAADASLKIRFANRTVDDMASADEEMLDEDEDEANVA